MFDAQRILGALVSDGLDGSGVRHSRGRRDRDEGFFGRDRRDDSYRRSNDGVFDGVGVGTAVAGAAGLAAAGGLAYMAYKHFSQPSAPGMPGAQMMPGAPGMPGAPAQPGFFNQLMGSSSGPIPPGGAPAMGTAPGYPGAAMAGLPPAGGMPNYGVPTWHNDPSSWGSSAPAPQQQWGSAPNQPSPQAPPQQWGTAPNQPPQAPPQQWGAAPNQPPQAPPQQWGGPATTPPSQWGAAPNPAPANPTLPSAQPSEPQYLPQQSPAAPPPQWDAAPNPPAVVVAAAAPIAAATATPAAAIPPPADPLPAPSVAAPAVQPSTPMVAAPMAPSPEPPQSPSPPAASAPSPEAQADALLLIRAMITAAFIDGEIDPDERARIMGRLAAAGLGPEEQAALAREFDAPQPPFALVGQIRSPQMAEQFYLVSILGAGTESEAERSYLKGLPPMLGLKSEDVARLHQGLGIPAIS